MKFTLTEAVETLRKDMTAGGKKLNVSDRTLTKFIESLYNMGVNDETEIADFIAKVKPSVEDLEGNYRKDLSEKYKTLQDDWKKNHPEPKPSEEKPNENDNPMIKQLLDKIVAMEERENQRNAERVAGEKRTQLIEAIKSKGVTNDKFISGVISRTTITNETDVDAEAQKAVDWFNELGAQIETPPAPNKPGVPPSDTAHMFDDLVNRKE